MVKLSPQSVRNLDGIGTENLNVEAIADENISPDALKVNRKFGKVESGNLIIYVNDGVTNVISSENVN